MKILVTGGAGYIGSHTCIELLNEGHEVVVMDNLYNASEKALERVEKITGKKVIFYKEDMLNKEGMNKIFEEQKIDAVIHFAGLKAVGESVAKPLEYYHNNMTGTFNLCDVMRNHGVKNLIFSSSATVYGDPAFVPITEAVSYTHLEVELAYAFGKGDVLAITGTNGKTTTTSLLGAIMEHARSSVFVVGNIGNPYTAAVEEMNEDSVTVAEISSFQLETTEHFHPKVSAILNITPDHLNRHHTMEEYIRVKELITANQTAEDTCVLNYEDEVLRKFGETLKTKVIFFSSARKLNQGMYYENGAIFYHDGTVLTKICDTDELNLLGLHNFENVMAAVAMALAYGVSPEEIRYALLRFHAVEHRIEYVTEKNGVAYYNDSKGTNPCLLYTSGGLLRRHGGSAGDPGYLRKCPALSGSGTGRACDGCTGRGRVRKPCVIGKKDVYCNYSKK